MTVSPAHLTRDIDPATGARRITLSVDLVALLAVPLLSLLAAWVRKSGRLDHR